MKFVQILGLVFSLTIVLAESEVKNDQVSLRFEEFEKKKKNE